MKGGGGWGIAIQLEDGIQTGQTTQAGEKLNEKTKKEEQ